MTDAELRELQERGHLPHHDRRVGLIAFGTLLIIGGLLMLAAAPLVLVSQLLLPLAGAAGAGMPTAQLVGVVVALLAMGSGVITLGIGSIRCRRWARALVLAIAGICAAFGLLGMVSLLLIGTGAFGPMMDSMPAGAGVALVVAMASTALIMYVVLPGTFILFYRGWHVKRTCEVAQPAPSWTDRLPVTVLAAALVLAARPVFGLMSLLAAPMVPCFGYLLHGWPAVPVILVLDVVFLVVAWQIYRLRPVGWWLAIGLTVTGALSSILTYSRVSADELVAIMEYTDQQRAAMEMWSVPLTEQILIGAAGHAILFSAYLFYVRHAFQPAAEAAQREIIVGGSRDRDDHYAAPVVKPETDDAAES
jgi:hypothetical protein